MDKIKHIIIILILLTWVSIISFNIYSANNIKDIKNEDIIQHKELYLKVVDRIFIGRADKTDVDIYDVSRPIVFTKNALIIPNSKEYAVLPLDKIRGLPLENIKKYNKNSKIYNIFVDKDNPNVSTITPCYKCEFEKNLDKVAIAGTRKKSCEIDTKDNIAKFKLTMLDSNGAVDKIKYFPCIPDGLIKNHMVSFRSHESHNMNYDYDIKYSYNQDIYFAEYATRLYPNNYYQYNYYQFIIGTKDKVLLEAEYNIDISIHNAGYDHNKPYSLSPDMTKFAMVDEDSKKIRIYTFDNNSIKTDVLTDIKVKSDRTYLLLRDNGYLYVYHSGLFKDKYTLYKINDFTKSDEYEYYKIDIEKYPYMHMNGDKEYVTIKDNYFYRYKVIGKTGTLYKNYNTISPDHSMTVVVDFHGDYAEFYLCYLEEVDEKAIKY